MKKIFIYTYIVIAVFILWMQQVIAADCNPTFNRNYTVEGNCTWPVHPLTWNNVKVFGNITVGNYTVTIPSWVVLGINLGSNKITFNTGKILMSGTAKIDNSPSERFYKSKSYTSGAGSINITNCHSGGYEPLNRINANIPTDYVGSTVRNVNQNGVMHCGK